MSWASIMATLWSMVVEWSVLSAEFPTNVPKAKTAAHLTCNSTTHTTPLAFSPPRSVMMLKVKSWLRCGLVSAVNAAALAFYLFLPDSDFRVRPFTPKTKYSLSKLIQKYFNVLWNQWGRVLEVIIVQYSLTAPVWNSEMLDASLTCITNSLLFLRCLIGFLI